MNTIIYSPVDSNSKDGRISRIPIEFEIPVYLVHNLIKKIYLALLFGSTLEINIYIHIYIWLALS